MLTFMGLDWDEAPKRAAKLKALQAYYKTTPAKAFNMLSADAMSTKTSSRGTNLVINSHGNAKVFAGFNPQDFLDQLISKGFENKSFMSVYLMACKVGEASQDNSIITNFARDLKRKLIGNGIDTKLYAPRGTLSYKMGHRTESGQTYWVVDEIYIKTPERNYPLNEGMLLVL